jgi:hypothetical protein
MTPEERWTVPAAELLEMSLHRERGRMVVEDLQALPRSPLVIAEGTTLPAGAVEDRARAVWLIPTPDFQRARLEERELAHGPRLLYRLLSEAIEREADEHGVRTLAVDGSRSIDATVEAVERLFAHALAEGPCAETLEERRVLLREANQAVVAQVRGYYGRPWADGDPDELVRTFVCECGDRSCEEMAQVPVRAAAAAPVVTAGHV